MSFPLDFYSDPHTNQLIIEDGDLQFTPTVVDSLAQRLEIRLNPWIVTGKLIKISYIP